MSDEVTKEVVDLRKQLEDSRDLVAKINGQHMKSEARCTELKIEVGVLLVELKELSEMLDESGRWNDEAWARISHTQNVLVEMEKSRIDSVRTGIPMKRLNWDVTKLHSCKELREKMTK